VTSTHRDSPNHRVRATPRRNRHKTIRGPTPSVASHCRRANRLDCGRSIPVTAFPRRPTKPALQREPGPAVIQTKHPASQHRAPPAARTPVSISQQLPSQPAHLLSLPRVHEPPFPPALQDPLVRADHPHPAGLAPAPSPRPPRHRPCPRSPAAPPTTPPWRMFPWRVRLVIQTVLADTAKRPPRPPASFFHPVSNGQPPRTPTPAGSVCPCADKINQP